MKKQKERDQRSRPSLSENSAPGGRGKGRQCEPGYRLKAVKLHLEEGYPAALVAQELGCALSSVRRWVKWYRNNGEEGLRAERPRGGAGRRGRRRARCTRSSRPRS